MARRSEIVARAQAELQAAIDRFSTLRAEILRQQRDVLSTNSAAARAALEKFDAADTDAFERHQAALSDADSAVVDAEFKASSARFAADEAASADWRDASDRAALKRQHDTEDAEAEFDEAFKNAQKVSGAAHDRAIKSARERRDDKIETIEAVFRRDTDNVWRAFEAASAENREKEIAAFEAARAKQASAGEDAAAALDAARAKANQALDKALSADPLAASIREAFRIRMEDAEVSAEREKQDILDRMKADLDNATP
jgi:hypothetical protein